MDEKSTQHGQRTPRFPALEQLARWDEAVVKRLNAPFQRMRKLSLGPLAIAAANLIAAAAIFTLSKQAYQSAGTDLGSVVVCWAGPVLTLFFLWYTVHWLLVQMAPIRRSWNKAQARLKRHLMGRLALAAESLFAAIILAFMTRTAYQSESSGILFELLRWAGPALVLAAIFYGVHMLLRELALKRLEYLERGTAQADEPVG